MDITRSCFHCVAVAQCLNIIDSYISWFITNWKQPSLTKLTNTVFIRIEPGCLFSINDF